MRSLTRARPSAKVGSKISVNLRESAGKGWAKKSVRKAYSAVALSRSARWKEWKGVSRKVGGEVVVRWEGRAVVRAGERMSRRRGKGMAEGGGWEGRRLEDGGGFVGRRMEGSLPRASVFSRW